MTIFHQKLTNNSNCHLFFTFQILSFCEHISACSSKLRANNLKFHSVPRTDPAPEDLKYYAQANVHKSDFYGSSFLELDIKNQ